MQVDVITLVIIFLVVNTVVVQSAEEKVQFHG